MSASLRGKSGCRREEGGWGDGDREEGRELCGEVAVWRGSCCKACRLEFQEELDLDMKRWTWLQEICSLTYLLSVASSTTGEHQSSSELLLLSSLGQLLPQIWGKPYYCDLLCLSEIWHGNWQPLSNYRVGLFGRPVHCSGQEIRNWKTQISKGCRGR